VLRLCHETPAVVKHHAAIREHSECSCRGSIQIFLLIGHTDRFENAAKGAAREPRAAALINIPRRCLRHTSAADFGFQASATLHVHSSDMPESQPAQTATMSMHGSTQ
jgi:hypothetical protein